MLFDRSCSSPRFKVQLKYQRALILLVAFWLVGTAEIGARTIKSQFSSSSTGAVTPSSHSKKNMQKNSTRRSRRHRRLKISRSLKPMPALSEAPFSADVALLKLIEEAKSQLEKETVRYIAAGGKSSARRDVKFALAHFKTG